MNKLIELYELSKEEILNNKKYTREFLASYVVDIHRTYNTIVKAYNLAVDNTNKVSEVLKELSKNLEKKKKETIIKCCKVLDRWCK